MRESWTDERMDDFAKHVDQRFDGVDRRLDEMNARFDKVDDRFEALQRLMLQSSVLVIATLIGLIATQL